MYTYAYRNERISYYEAFSLVNYTTIIFIKSDYMWAQCTGCSHRKKPSLVFIYKRAPPPHAIKTHPNHSDTQ